MAPVLPVETKDLVKDEVTKPVVDKEMPKEKEVAVQSPEKVVLKEVPKVAPQPLSTPKKELQALTKSDSRPCTPVKGTITPVKQKGLTATPIERVVPETAPESPIPTALHLPYHMERLLELFRTCETIVSTLYNRSEVCSFDRIKPAVQEVVRRCVYIACLVTLS